MRTRVNSIELNYSIRGNGQPTIVFMHYFGGSSLEWQAVVDQLANDYRCVAFDLRGQGDSEAPDSGYSVDDMTDDLAGLVQQLDLTDYVVVGHSQSGKVALNFASRRPLRLRALILLSPSPPKPEPIPDADRQAMLLHHGEPDFAEETFGKITVKPLSDDVKQQIINDNLRTSTAAWNAWLKQGSLEDIADRMTTVAVPIAIVTGAADTTLAPEVQPKLTLSYLKNATFDTLPGGGHLLPYEMPMEVAAFIQKKVSDFL